MELIKAYINNFGRLSNLEIDFKKGLNVFIHENGWGKTTLSVFIKAMLYGMETSAKQNLDENEKKKYLPWQGGLYGGNLIFSHHGKEYKVTRTFSSRKNSDTFELLDLKTNKISNDFSSDLGSEIFGVNRETFARSAHVNLSQTPAGSTDISAKLNNLVEAADISSFDKALKNLQDRAREIDARRGGKGLIYEIQDKIDYDRSQLEEIKALSGQNIELEKRVSFLESEAEKYSVRQKELNNLMAESARFESKLRYEELKNEEKSAEKARAELEDFFNGQIPDSKALSVIDSLLQDFTTLDSNLKTNALNQSEKDQYEALNNYFAGDRPTQKQIDLCLKSDSDYRKFCQEEGEKKLSQTENGEFELLKNKFAACDLTEEKINRHIMNFSEVQKIRSDLLNLKSELSGDRDKLSENIKKSSFVFVLLPAFTGLLSLLLACFFFVKFKNPLYFAAGAAPALILFIAAGIFGKKGGKKNPALEEKIKNLEGQIKDMEERSLTMENAYKSLIHRLEEDGENDILSLNKIAKDFSRYDSLLQKSKLYYQWLQSQQKLAVDYEEELKAFVRRYCRTSDITSIPAEIQALNGKLSLLRELEARVNSDADNSRLQAEKKEKLNQILTQYKTEKTLTFKEQVQQLHDRLVELKNNDERILAAREKISAFESDEKNDPASLEKLTKPEKSLDEIKAEQNSVMEKIKTVNAEIAGLKKTIEENLSQIDRKDDIESEIENLREEKRQKGLENQLYLKTADFLSKAKENLDANYSDPMKKGFAKYVGMMAGENAAKALMIDTDLKVFASDRTGLSHESDFLSEGYKDLVNFCSRMALVDALFTESRTPLILDDPFVNLDDDKVPKALELVKEIAKENQVLYFACHKSREVK